MPAYDIAAVDAFPAGVVANLSIGNIAARSPVSLPTSLHHISTSNIPVIAGVISGSIVIIAWVVASFLILKRVWKRHRQGHKTHAKPGSFILPPDPAVIEGKYAPGTYMTKDEHHKYKKSNPSSQSARGSTIASIIHDMSNVPSSHENNAK
ncbi:hypothetical protein K439DRAFT_574383 [Ramaria rubella]|nr:hypothetical protein K439DRAFT_574383 [Ramaria rubella]